MMHFLCVAEHHYELGNVEHSAMIVLRVEIDRLIHLNFNVNFLLIV